MNDLLSKLKRMVSEPKVFALMVSSQRGQILYLGIHFSLEEAYSAARQKMETFAQHKPGDAVDIDLWNAVSAREVITKFIEPSEIDKIFALPKGASKTPIDRTIERIMSSAEDMPNEMFDAIGMMEDIVQKVTMEPNPDGKLPLIIRKRPKREATTEDRLREAKKTRNDLMKKLIADGDVKQVEKASGFLGPSSVKYVKAAIAKKNKVIKKS